MIEADKLGLSLSPRPPISHVGVVGFSTLQDLSPSPPIDYDIAKCFLRWGGGGERQKGSAGKFPGTVAEWREGGALLPLPPPPGQCRQWPFRWAEGEKINRGPSFSTGYQVVAVERSGREEEPQECVPACN